MRDLECVPPTDARLTPRAEERPISDQAHRCPWRSHACLGLSPCRDGSLLRALSVERGELVSSGFVLIQFPGQYMPAGSGVRPRLLTSAMISAAIPAMGQRGCRDGTERESYVHDIASSLRMRLAIVKQIIITFYQRAQLPDARPRTSGRYRSLRVSSEHFEAM